MHAFLVVIAVISAIIMVISILLQAGSSDMGALFGGASTETVFGAEGAGGFLAKVTAVTATIFLLASLTLAKISGPGKVKSVVLTGKKKTVIEKKVGTTKAAPTKPANKK